MSSYEIIPHKTLTVGVRITRIEWGTRVENHFDAKRCLGVEVVAVDNTEPPVYLVSQYIAATSDESDRTYCGPMGVFESRTQANAAFRELQTKIQSVTKCILCGQYTAGHCGHGFQAEKT